MIQTFKNTGTEDIYDDINSGVARRCCPQALWLIARRKLDQINRAQEVSE
jgi:proteic killer suppression protein